MTRSAPLVAYILLWLALVARAIDNQRVRRWPGWTADAVAGTAWFALLAGLAARGFAAGHWPLANRYEFALGFEAAILAVYLWLDTRSLGAAGQARGAMGVLAAALVVGTYALFRPAAEQAITPLVPALDSIWLGIHVVASAIGYGAAAVAAGLAAVVLATPRAAALEGEPPIPGLDCTLERMLAFAFPWLTLGLLSGAVWAQQAWGSYWSWDPKESWALITWLWYLLILHLRGRPGWQGRRRAALAVAGLALVSFTFAGLPWFVRTLQLTSLHGF